MLYRAVVRSLGDLISPRALERILADAARERHLSLSSLDVPTLQDILKREVYKRLQLSVTATVAKARVQQLLTELDQRHNEVRASTQTQIVTLEDQAKRFGLYFDWPETQRLRAVLGVMRQYLSGEAAGGGDESAAGSHTRQLEELLLEGIGLVESLERRLAEELVTQGSDLSDIKAALGQLGGVGGPRVRRLEALIKQISEAQTNRTLLPAEVERAMSLVLELRRHVASSVVQRTDAGSEPAGEASSGAAQASQDKELRGLEREHGLRLLQDLGREYEAVMELRPELRSQWLAARTQLESGEGAEGAESAANDLRDRLSEARRQALLDQRARLGSLEERLQRLGEDGEELLLRASLTRRTLEAGVLAPPELAQLDSQITALEAQLRPGSDDAGREHASQLLQSRQDLLLLEQAAREVPGGLPEIAAGLGTLHARLDQGEAASAEALWSLLQRRMGEVAVQRSEFDARADAIIAEYDQYRMLAGETILRLGRLADVLRAQRQLGTLSVEAHERYAGSLRAAEELLGEARAEHAAAQRITSTFAAADLSDLLGVFDAEPSLPLERDPYQTDVAGLLIGGPLDPRGSGEAEPETARPAETAVWLVRAQLVLSGDLEAQLPGTRPWPSRAACETEVLRVAHLAAQAGELGAERLELCAHGRYWLAQPQGDEQQGGQLVVCAVSAEAARAGARQWAAHL